MHSIRPLRGAGLAGGSGGALPASRSTARSTTGSRQASAAVVQRCSPSGPAWHTPAACTSRRPDPVRLPGVEEGTFVLFEDAMDKGKRTPLHIHSEADEAMYVLEGEIVMPLDGVDESVAAGGPAVAPRGVPHAFLVTADGTKILCLQTPGCCEAFYLGASEPLTPETVRVVDFDRIRLSGAVNGGIEILGPPPFADES